jgi:hypothetical protein
MKWVMLSQIDGHSVALRVDLLTRIVESNGYTEVFVQDGAIYTVTESVEEILEFIDADDDSDPMEDF